MEESSAQLAAIGKLVAHHLVVDIPADEDTRQEAHHGQEDLTGDEIEQIEQRLAKICHSIDGPQRQRAEGSDNGSAHRHQQGGALAGGVQLFLEECRRDLVERYERCQCCQRQQQEEQQRDDVAHGGDTGEGLFEDVGQRDEDERRSAVGRDAHRECRGENHESGQDGHEAVDDGNLRGRLSEVGMVREVAGVGTQTAHGDAHGIERLAEGAKEHVAGDFREVGLEQKLDALLGMGQQARSTDNDEQQDEQGGHHEF